MTTDSLSAETFRNPGAAWRGKPFWSWNGKLDKDELIRQIHVLKEMGMGGYFMHSRVGLATEYLGEEWFDLTNACAEEGARLGMESWLYDEDRWPSGTAGGMVTENPDYQMKFIHMERFDGAEFNLDAWNAGRERPLGTWSCRVENEIDVYDVAPINAATPRSEFAGRTILAFSIVPMAKGAFYNGNTYVDTMKREATEEYIRVTHEAYKTHCGHHFGTTIKGIFTDEPHRGPYMSGFGSVASGANPIDFVPWTDAIFDVFAETYGIQVEERLPSLFLRENGKEMSQIKAQYADVMLRLFLDNFAKPYYDWCDENDLQVTGHVLHENSLSCQVSTNGSVQRYYPHMHVPGIDYLCEHGRDYWVAKQIDSTARQFDQPWILSELYGCTGWQMNFESHKAIGAWQALFGVNLRCHHLSWFTMAGEAKRDYPASILHQSPWYKEYDVVETWFARLGYFRSQGKPCCDLLVLNPVESVWGRVYPGAIQGMGARDEGIRDLERKYSELFHILAGNQIDFDYGDEALMAEYAVVTKKDDKPVLSFGSMDYATVLVSGADTIRGTTLELLRRFVETGGTVIFAGDVPAYLDSVASSAVQELAASATTCPFDEVAVVAAVVEHSQQRVTIVDAKTGEAAREVFCQLRKDDDASYLTILNVNRDQSIAATVTLCGLLGTAVEEWTLDTGDAVRVQASNEYGISFDTTLHTSQARCYRIVNASSLPMVGPTVTGSAGDAVRLDGPARYTLADVNVSVLDVPRWSLNGTEHPADEILQIDREVRTTLGVPTRGGDMLQPWFRGKQAFDQLGDLTLTYTIEVADLDSLTDAQLVLETPGQFTLAINGTAVDTSADAGWWVDVALRRILLPDGILEEGTNEITLSCAFREDLNLEAMYLLGHFAVTLDGTTPVLGALPETVLPSDVVGQGFPYYSDSITYHYDVPAELRGKPVTVSIPSYEGAYAKVSSGGEIKIIPWRPNETDVTLADVLDVEVCITRKNTFGPLHLTNPRPGAVGPGHFVTSGDSFSLAPVFIESGLLAPVEITPLAE